MIGTIVFVVALLLGLWIVYLPRRTLERWEGQKVVSGETPRKHSGSDDRSG